jgi:hypothetical protein
MDLFLEKHKCNKVCKALELPNLVRIPWQPRTSTPGNIHHSTVNSAHLANDIGQSTSNIHQSTGNTGQTNEQTPGPTNRVADADLGLISVVRLGTQALRSRFHD